MFQIIAWEREFVESAAMRRFFLRKIPPRLWGGGEAGGFAARMAHSAARDAYEIAARPQSSKNQR